VTDPVLVPGLAGIPAAKSSISFIDGTAGILAYRGHRIEVLAEHSNYEETCFLILEGRLPTASELETFRGDLAARRGVEPAVVQTLSSLPKNGHPMNGLQVGLATLAMTQPKVDVKDPASVREAVLRLIAATPTLIATLERLRRGDDYLAPTEGSNSAEAFLYMLNGEAPSAIAERTLDCCFVLHAEHTMNASTFAARVVGSTESGPYTVASSAVGALYGPLHGGANERVLQALESIGGPEQVAEWYAAKRTSGGKVMGFGHRVYKTKDPRAHTLQRLAGELFEAHGSTPLYDTALELEKAVVADLGDRGIHPNVDFFSGIVYQKLGIPTDAFTPIFALARMVGWLAHYEEQHQNNRLFRPAQIYTGVHDAPWVPIEERG